MARQGQGEISIHGKLFATPSLFIDKLQERYGKFHLDAAAQKHTAKAPMYFGPDHRVAAKRNALKRNWDIRGEDTNVFLNWPYGIRENLVWSRYAWHQARDRGIQVVGLGPGNCGDTFWWHRVALRAHEICYVEGRIAFELDGVPMEGNAFNSVIIVWRPHDNERPIIGPSIQVPKP